MTDFPFAFAGDKDDLKALGPVKQEGIYGVTVILRSVPPRDRVAMLDIALDDLRRHMLGEILKDPWGDYDAKGS